MKDNAIINKLNICIYAIIVMSIVYIPIDTRAGISPLKIASCALSPVILLFFSPKISRAFFLGLIYIGSILFTSLFNYESFRPSTIIYNFLLLLFFCMYYNLVYLEKAFSIDKFMHFIKQFIFVLFMVLVIQQVAILLGLKLLPFINLAQVLDRGIGANSLTAEPSTFARILTVLYLGYIRLLEIKLDKENIPLIDIITNERRLTFCFVWCMVTMGSGTAFISLGILLIYFIRIRTLLFSIPVLICLYFISQSIDFVPLQRAINIVEATLTLDNEIVMQTDGSASVRIIPIINTITKLDYSSANAWFGHGIDYGLSKGLSSDRLMIGGISDYGLISFFASLLFVYSCIIRKFWSLESLMFIILCQMSIKNIPVFWGMFMIWSTVSYFQNSNQRKKVNYQQRRNLLEQ